QVMFVLENAPMPELRLADLVVAPVAVDSASAKFPLALLAYENGESITCLFEYNTALFEEETISRMAKNYELLLEQMTKQPAVHLSVLVRALQVLDPAERRKVLVDFNSAMRPLPAMYIPELFEQQVQRTPNSLAIIIPEGQLTYQDLNRRANQLARHLQRRGISMESRVGILMERSLDMFVAVMAVLKAGAAYVPLDCQHPAERISYVLADA